MNDENKGKLIQWYPGHMAKTKKEISTIISNIDVVMVFCLNWQQMICDVVIEVIDARIPYSSRIPDLAKITHNKKSIVVFNKYDLCDKFETEKWINRYQSNGSICVTTDSKNTNDYKKIIESVKSLMIDVNNKRKQKGLLPKKAKCIVIGVPNVGKSTIINRIVGKNIAGIGNKPGVTKNLSTIRINEFMDLVDTPGILWPKFSDQNLALNLASMTAIKEEILTIETVAIHILKSLSKFYKNILKENFGIEEYNDDEIEECFTAISKFKNIPVNGEVDYEKVSLVIINSIKQEKIKGITFDRV